jgi:hypothetical protein
MILVDGAPVELIWFASGQHGIERRDSDSRVSP